MRPFSPLAVLVLAAPASLAWLGPTPRTQDKVDRDGLEFITEHRPERVMDGRFLSLPWVADPLEAGHWPQTIRRAMYP